MCIMTYPFLFWSHLLNWLGSPAGPNTPQQLAYGTEVKQAFTRIYQGSPKALLIICILPTRATVAELLSRHGTHLHGKLRQMCASGLCDLSQRPIQTCILRYCVVGETTIELPYIIPDGKLKVSHESD